jgi:hypothetical protein
MCPIYLDVLWKVEPAFTNYCGVDASPGVCFNEIAALLNTCFYDEATPCPPDENDF